jgi:hypothetical protein
MKLSVEQLLSQSSTSHNQPDRTKFGYNDDSIENLIVDESELLYKMFAEVLTSKCINQIKNDR